MDKPPTGLTLQEVIEEFKKAPVRDYLSVEGVDREISDSKNWTNIRKDCIAYDISTTTRLREVTGSTKILDILKHIYIKELKPRDPNAPLDPCGIITWGFYLLSHDISPEAVEHVRQRIRKSNEYNKILIVTATPVETQAVLDVFKAGDSPAIIQNINGKLYYYLADCGDAQALLVTSGMGSATPTGSLVTVREFIESLRPTVVIMCGIAYGLRPNSQQLGTILIANRLYCYEPRKLDRDRGELPRGDRVSVSRRSLNHFQIGATSWKGAVTEFGLMLSGEVLVNDPDFRDWLLRVEPEAIGGEMEGVGLYAAATDAKVDWILVKAICDWADGNKDKDKDNAQKVAAHNAAQFVMHVLKQGGWSES